MIVTCWSTEKTRLKTSITSNLLHGLVATSKISITQCLTGWMSFPLKKHVIFEADFKSCENSCGEISTAFNPISCVKCNLLLVVKILTCQPRNPRSLSLPHSSSLGRDAGTQMRVFSPSRISKSAPRQLLMTCEMEEIPKHFWVAKRLL